MDSEPLSSNKSPYGWTRQRVIFLALSAAVAFGVIWWSREVLLPFILALIIAYVLTPLVAFCEQKKMPRAVAICVVYAVTLSALYGAIASIAPRLYQETLQLTRESPLLAKRLAEKWGPWIDER